MKPISLKRKIVITDATWATGDWTLTAGANHFIGVGDTFTFTTRLNRTNPVQEAYTATTITGTATTTIKFTGSADLEIPSEIYVDNFGTGYNSSLDFTFQHGTTINGIIHVVSNGTATSTGAQVFGSIDNIHWVSLANSAAITAESQIEVAVTKPYVYGRLTIATTAAAGGGANTIKAWKAGC
jgi:hypothetical protein